ncbi:MAG: hypothetical protein JSV64_05305 [Candidatus Bathyarchaeota archaeon]|nr:MAG: hypothetical protein JSV64_05305 [Candidatus Bathyarchaeota archaeon]
MGGVLRDIIGGLKRRKPVKKYCPKCGNPNISLSSKFDIWLLPEQYTCDKCGYRGAFALEIDDEKHEHKCRESD